MSFELNALFSLSIAFGAIAGWIRVRRTDPAFLPFLWYTWLGLSNEILSIVLSESGYSNAINYNVFMLMEALLLTWQFKKWFLFGKKNIYYLLQGLFITGWMLETFVTSKGHLFNSYFIILHSIFMVVMSVNMINKVMFEEPSALFKNSVFLICMGLIVFFTYFILVEAFWLNGLNRSRSFRIHVYEILPYVNLFTNLIFALAILCIPLKRQYILRY